MKILITNDDSISSEVLLPLAKWAKQFGEVTVVVPKYEQSGKSHCIEFRKAFEVKQVPFDDPDINKKYGRAWKCIRDRHIVQHPLCEQCEKEGKLIPAAEVHHKIPISKGGTHARENLMSLCRSCHNKIHHELGDR